MNDREELLAKLRERILGVAASRLQRDAAEDLTQEVLVVLHVKYAHLDSLDDLLPLGRPSRKPSNCRRTTGDA
jgi:RNA polymerase sigma-70 factor (ECF subfamily)